nr:hypothetical protein Iba_chr10bCG8250 [Ipomoea batatas]
MVECRALGKVEKLMTLPVLGGKYFDYPILDTFGCREGVEDLIAHHQWGQVFAWRRQTYALAIYEFIATLKVKSEKYHNNFVSSNTNSKAIVRKDLKAVRHALAMTFTGRILNMHNVYRADLFHLWSMKNDKLMNMRVQCKKWLAT